MTEAIKKKLEIVKISKHKNRPFDASQLSPNNSLIGKFVVATTVNHSDKITSEVI